MDVNIIENVTYIKIVAGLIHTGYFLSVSADISCSIHKHATYISYIYILSIYVYDHAIKALNFKDVLHRSPGFTIYI